MDIRKETEIKIFECPVSDIRKFIETNHYSKNINGVKISVCFKLLHGEELIGAALFGEMSTTAWKRFGTSEKDVLELRRLVLVDDTPRNTESWFLSRILKLLRASTKYKICVSYADPNHGHTGIIYKATNFVFMGMSGRDVGFKDTETGKIYHSRALRTKYKGDFKPFVKKLRQKLEEGILIPIDLLPKYCYTYNLNDKRKRSR
jgi:hypothetical protein